jgi:hypothetical protein
MEDTETKTHSGVNCCKFHSFHIRYEYTELIKIRAGFIYMRIYMFIESKTIEKLIRRMGASPKFGAFVSDRRITASRPTRTYIWPKWKWRSRSSNRTWIEWSTWGRPSWRRRTGFPSQLSGSNRWP